MADVFFIVDGEKLEAQAHFLAASILKHMQGKDRFFAYKREGRALPHSLLDLFDKASIEIREIPDTEVARWETPYPIGNKLLAAADKRSGGVSVFMDTDMVFHRPAQFEGLLDGAPVAAVLSDYRAAVLQVPSDWEPVYDMMGVEMSQERPGTLRRPGLDYPPYFNAGLVVFDESYGDQNINVGQVWLDMSLELDAATDLGEARRYLDQITLSALGGKLGRDTKQLPQRLNYNIMGWEFPKNRNVDIAHYHIFGRMWRTPEVGLSALSNLREALSPKQFSEFVEAYRPHLYWRKARKMEKAHQA